MKIPEQAPVGWWEWLSQGLIMGRGYLVISLNSVRRHLGRSYYPQRDPFKAGLFGGAYTRAQVLRTLRIPAVMGPGWQRVGTIPCPSGTLAFSDPGEFPEWQNDFSTRVEGIPQGAHRLELQQVRLRRPYGEHVLRARLLWADAGDDPDYECVGAVATDLVRICVYDPSFVRQVAQDDLRAKGFDPIELMSGPDYQNLDPVGVGQAFFHVFRSGFGSGCYPMFCVRNLGEFVGILLDMTGMLDGNGVPYEGMKVVSVRHRAT